MTDSFKPDFDGKTSFSSVSTCFNLETSNFVTSERSGSESGIISALMSVCEEIEDNENKLEQTLHTT